MTPWLRPVQLIALGSLLACGETVQPTYSIDLLAAPDKNPFQTATRVELQVGTGPKTEVRPMPGMAFELAIPGQNAMALSGPVHVRGFDANNQLVAYGRTPTMDYILADVPFAVFVQPPGTIEALPVSRQTGDAMYRHFATSVEATAITGRSACRTAMYGLGLTAVRGANGQPEILPYAAVTVFDPYVMGPTQPRAIAGSSAGLDVSSVALDGGRVVSFGGHTRATFTAGESWAVAQMWTTQLSRSAGFGFSVSDAVVPDPGTPTEAPLRRGGARAVAIGSLAYAFGGDGLQEMAGALAPAPLASVVVLDPTQTDAGLARKLLGTNMLAARKGHTATVVQTTVAGQVETSVLLFGGAAPEAPVAERFIPGPTPRFEAIATTAEPRSGHAAVKLPNGRVLILGGVGADGVPLATSWLYDPVTTALTPGPVMLAVPRAEAAIFTIGNDLVVAGGRDAAGAGVPNAERFELAGDTFAPLGAVPAFPRWGATATLLENEAILLVGGQALDAPSMKALPVSLLEVYQPRRAATP